MVVLPIAHPVTVPVAFIVALAVLLDVQTPPGVALLKSVVLFTHTAFTPVIGAGVGFTNTDLLREQPVGNV